VSSTKSAGVSPATIEQNRQAAAIAGRAGQSAAGDS